MFKNMKIGLRMGLGFAVLLALMVVLIMVGLNAMKKINAELEATVKYENLRTELANNMINAARETDTAVRGILLAKFRNRTSESIQKMRDDLVNCWKAYNESAARLKELITKEDARGVDLLSKEMATGDSARQQQDQVIELALAGRLEEGAGLMAGKAYPTVRRWVSEITDHIRYEDERTVRRFEETEKKYATARATMFALGAVAIALAAVIGVFLTMGIVRPLRRMSLIAVKIGKGDLSDRTGYISSDEIGDLSKAFDLMTDYLERMAGVARSIAKNDFTVQSAPLSERDMLGNAFAMMIENLREMTR